MEYQDSNQIYQVQRNVQRPGFQYQRNPEAEYGNHIINTSAIANTSITHTCGNVLGLVEMFLVRELREINFRTVTVSTEMASRQLIHLPHKLLKKEAPLMVLSPRISFGQDDGRFLANTLMNSRPNAIASFWGNGSLLQLGQDKRKGIYMHGHYNRMVMFIDILLSFDTYAEQQNAMGIIHSCISINNYQFIRAPLELYLPRQYVDLFSHIARVPIYENDSVGKFMTYMNQCWFHPITYKLKGGSNTDEFFMYYLADIDTFIQEPNYDNGIKDGQTRRAFNINMTMRCDFNTVNYLTLNAPDIKSLIKLPPLESSMTSTITSMFSDVINLDDFSLPVGWIAYSWPIFKLKEGEHTVELGPILNDSLNAVIDHHLKFNIPMKRFIEIQFRENGTILSNEAYFIDWQNRVLHVMNPDHRRTYRLLVTISPEYINNLIKDITDLE